MNREEKFSSDVSEKRIVSIFGVTESVSGGCWTRFYPWRLRQ